MLIFKFEGNKKILKNVLKQSCAVFCGCLRICDLLNGTQEKVDLRKRNEAKYWRICNCGLLKQVCLPTSVTISARVTLSIFNPVWCLSIARRQRNMLLAELGIKKNSLFFSIHDSPVVGMVSLLIDSLVVCLY
jgi:hypothetical protein